MIWINLCPTSYSLRTEQRLSQKALANLLGGLMGANWIGFLLDSTFQSFRDLQLTLNWPQVLFFDLGWLVWAILHTPFIWGHLPAFTSSFLWMVQDGLPAVVLTVLLAVLLAILPH